MTTEKNPNLGILISDGECVFTCWMSEDDTSPVMNEAQFCVNEKIGWVLRHELPIKVTPELEKKVDVQVYILKPSDKVQLPLQQWFDEFYQDQQDMVVRDQNQDEKRFLELLVKYGDQVEALKEKHGG